MMINIDSVFLHFSFVKIRVRIIFLIKFTPSKALKPLKDKGLFKAWKKLSFVIPFQ